MELLLVLLGSVLGIGLLVSGGKWMLSPLDRASNRRQQITQWQVVDVLALSFLLAAPLAVILSIAGQGRTADERLVMIELIVGFTAVVIWWNCSVRLTRAGIRRASHRMAFLMIVAPLAYVGSIACFIYSAMAFLPTNARAEFYLQFAALLIAMYAAGLFTRYIVKEAAREEEAEAAEAAPSVEGSGSESLAGPFESLADRQSAASAEPPEHGE